MIRVVLINLWVHDVARVQALQSNSVRSMIDHQPSGNDRVIVVDHPLVQHKLTLLRDERTPVALFRQLIKEVAMLLGYEALAQAATVDANVVTPMGPHAGLALADDPVFVSVLRAGNGLLDGLLMLVPTAKVGFVGIARNHETLEAESYYTKLPNFRGRDVLLIDPMLATGNTAVAALSMVREQGAARVRLVSLVASPTGVAHVLEADADVTIVTAAVDPELDAKGYIVPGLGDAGDRIFGT